jgi:hypothetical protein
MVKRLAELFVLAACGEPTRHEGADNPAGMETVGGLHNGREALHGPVKDASGFVQGQDALVEQGLKHLDTDSPAS